ncbi:hypothetical protein DSECCO2_221450 [anaerobic digester metagenome]
MAEKSYFFNDINDDRVYLAEDFALFFSTLIGNGVFPNPSTNTQVLVNEETPMSITIKPGFAWINGYMYWNPDNLVKTLAVAYTNPRIDRVVIRWSSNNREIRADVITGTPAVVPVAPELTRNSDIWELAIADILVDGNATVITQAKITDTRLNNNLCGIVHGLFDQVDTTTLFNQYQAWFGEFSGDAEAEFNTFLAQLENALSGDVAGNLLVKINENAADIAVHTIEIEQNTVGINANTVSIIAIQTKIINQNRKLRMGGM